MDCVGRRHVFHRLDYCMSERDAMGCFAKGHSQSNTGKTHFKKGYVMSESHREKMKATHTRLRSGSRLPHPTKENHPGWKGGISSTKDYKNFYKKQHKHRKKNAVGSHMKEDWDNLKKKYNYSCANCKKQEPIVELTEDHIIPLSKRGSNNIENIQPLCRSCNGRKSNKTIKYKL